MRSLGPRAWILGLVIVQGCARLPDDAFALSSTSLQQRALQTRTYEDISEVEILSASAGVIQDLGYTIDESETELGIIAASKVADATNALQVTGAILLAALGGGAAVIDDEQHIKLGLVVIPSSSLAKAYDVRITIQRVVYNTQGQIARSETIEKVDVYEEFFEKLSKSVFLEENL